MNVIYLLFTQHSTFIKTNFNELKSGQVLYFTVNHREAAPVLRLLLTFGLNRWFFKLVSSSYRSPWYFKLYVVVFGLLLLLFPLKIEV